MSERTRGLWALLEFSAFYSGLQNLIAKPGNRREVVGRYMRPRAGDKLLDIGCGPADLLAYLPEVQYVGVDHNPDYIEKAKAKWGNRGRFICADVQSIADQEAGSFDLVVATGTLHHLSDGQVREVFSVAKALLKPGGRMFSIDPSFIDRQNLIARLLLKSDRGQHVRFPHELEKLAREQFPTVNVAVRTDLMRVPYAHAIVECTNSPGA